MKCARVKPGERILDVCTGTGDIAIRFARCNGVGKIVGIDLEEEMLHLATRKMKNKGIDSKIALFMGNALHLPFEDDSFDIVSIGFGLRNIGHYREAISEMVRVLKKGGRLLMLEFSPPRRDLFGVFYHLFLTTIIPAIGGTLSGSTAAYRYLSKSITNFPKPEKITQLMEQEGLKNTWSKPLTGGVVHIYWGEK